LNGFAKRRNSEGGQMGRSAAGQVGKWER